MRIPAGLRTALVAVALAGVGLSAARADTFLLKSGDRLRGTLVDEYATPNRVKWLRVETTFGTVSFEKAQLKRRVRSERTDGPLRVTEIVVTTMSGSVEKRVPGAETWQTLSPRDRARDTSRQRSNTPNSLVAPGDRVRTGPDGELDLDIGWGVVHVTSDSELEFQLEGASLGVLRGAAGARMTRLPKDQEFRVETPEASMGVRGTTFVVRAGGRLHVAVEEGEVTVASARVGAGAAMSHVDGQEPRSESITSADRAVFERLRRTYALPRLDRVRLPSGTFLFGPEPGTPRQPPGREKIRVSMPSFDMSRTEVTVAQFRVFEEFIAAHGDHSFCHPDEPIGHEHAAFAELPGAAPDRALLDGDDQPVMGISWYTAYAFAAWVGGRVPAEVEWEYAARGGAATRYPWGDSAAQMEDYAWFDENSGERVPDPPTGGGAGGLSRAEQAQRAGCRTHDVATLRPNGFGLYDMLGNAVEYIHTPWPLDRADVRPADGSARADPWDGMVLGGPHGHVGGTFKNPRADQGVSSVWFEPAERVMAANGIRVAW